MLQKIMSNPQGTVLAVIAAFALVSAILTGLEKLLLSCSDLLDTFKDKTGTDLDNKASEFFKKTAGVVSTVLFYTAKVISWINGFKTPTPTPSTTSVVDPESKPQA